MVRFVVLAALLSAAPAAADAPPSNLYGWSNLTVQVHPAARSSLRLVLDGIASKPTDTNAIGWQAVQLGHFYFPLQRKDVGTLANGIEEWLAAPHSDSVFSKASGSFGLAVTGNAWNPAVERVITFTTRLWTPDTNVAHFHGEHHVVLSETQAQELLDVLRLWLRRPGSVPTPLFRSTVY